VLSLKAYLDDSGEADQAVGGCIASVEAWAAFDTEWKAVLDRFHVDEFHAVRFENRTHQFKTMSESDRKPFRSALLDVLTRNVAPITGGAYVCAVAGPELVEQLKWRGGIGKNPPKRGKTAREIFVDKMVETLSDPYSVCLGNALNEVLSLVIAGQDTVQVFIADQPKRAQGIGYITQMIGGAPRFAGRVSGFTYGRDMRPNRVRPLQAADFAAYYLSKRKRDPANPVAWVANKLHPQFVTLVRDNAGLTDGWINGQQDWLMSGDKETAAEVVRDRVERLTDRLLAAIGPGKARPTGERGLEAILRASQRPPRL